MKEKERERMDALKTWLEKIETRLATLEQHAHSGHLLDETAIGTIIERVIAHLDTLFQPQPAQEEERTVAHPPHEGDTQ